MNPRSTDCEADALTTTPSSRCLLYANQNVQKIFVEKTGQSDNVRPSVFLSANYVKLVAIMLPLPSSHLRASISNVVVLRFVMFA